ncbi:unnamed protein product [Mesocestoides corti]|uniref:Uncharacterized protein n=1 Tax=Mesocestoides corti TaxID=53468 RepID=A0A158QTW2_MESCO|nr:unnamed protein product [Mesocestoides corti]
MPSWSWLDIQESREYVSREDTGVSHCDVGHCSWPLFLESRVPHFTQVDTSSANYPRNRPLPAVPGVRLPPPKWGLVSTFESVMESPRVRCDVEQVLIRSSRKLHGRLLYANYTDASDSFRATW